MGEARRDALREEEEKEKGRLFFLMLAGPQGRGCVWLSPELLGVGG